MLTRQQQRDLLRYFKALADQNRLTILGLLGQREHNVSDLAAHLSISEPTTSHHLARLRTVGLVTLHASGNQRIYRLNTARLREFKTLAASIEKLDLSDAPEDDLSWLDELNLSAADRKVLRDYTFQGRLTQIPTRQKKLLVILRWLAAHFQPGVHYTEREVNTIITRLYDDYATLRRDLVDFGFLRRERGGGKYWLTPDDDTIEDPAS